MQRYRIFTGLTAEQYGEFDFLHKFIAFFLQPAGQFVELQRPASLHQNHRILFEQRLHGLKQAILVFMPGLADAPEHRTGGEHFDSQSARMVQHPAVEFHLLRPEIQHVPEYCVMGARQGCQGIQRRNGAFGIGLVGIIQYMGPAGRLQRRAHAGHHQGFQCLVPVCR